MEIGELQNVESRNVLTDEATLRKRGGSTNPSASGDGAAGFCVGLNEFSTERSLTLQNCEAFGDWTASDAANFSTANDATIKVDGTNGQRLSATGAGANGDTLTHDLGAGATKDLSRYDTVEVQMRANMGTDAVFFGISEDNISYTEVQFSGDADTFQTVRFNITALGATARDAIRYLRFRYANSTGTARTIYVDLIKAISKAAYFVRFRGDTTPTGGVRDLVGTQTITMEELSNTAAGWASVFGGSFTGFLNQKIRTVGWNGNLYIMGGVALKYDGTTLQAWPEAPPSRFLEMHGEKLWALSQAWDPHGLRHTDVNSDIVWPVGTDPTARGAGGLFYVGRRYPYLPTGMKSAFGQLFLWTEGDLWILFGSDNSNYSLQRSHPGAGTLSNESIAVADDAAFWHDGAQNRLLMYRSQQVYDISDPIRSELEAIPTALKPWTASFFTGRYLGFTYADAAATVNTRLCLFDVLTQRWHGPYRGEWIGFNVGFMGLDGKVVVGKGTVAGGNNAGVRKVLTGTSDNGAAIDLVWKSGDLNPRSPHWSKRIRRAGIVVSNTTAVFTLNFYLNQSASAIRSYTLTGTGAAQELLSTGVHNDVVAPVIQAELTESSTNSVKINEFWVDGMMMRALR